MTLAVIGIVTQPVMAYTGPGLEVIDPPTIGRYVAYQLDNDSCGNHIYTDRYLIEAFRDELVRMTVDVPNIIPACGSTPEREWFQTIVIITQGTEHCTWKWDANHDPRFGVIAQNTEIIKCTLDLKTGQTAHLYAIHSYGNYKTYMENDAYSFNRDITMG